MILIMRISYLAFQLSDDSEQFIVDELYALDAWFFKAGYLPFYQQFKRYFRNKQSRFGSLTNKRGSGDDMIDENRILQQNGDDKGRTKERTTYCSIANSSTDIVSTQSLGRIKRIQTSGVYLIEYEVHSRSTIQLVYR